MTALTKIETINNSHDMAVIEQVVLQGDLSKLNPEQRVMYYNNVCKSLGLNPFTRPFDYIQLNGKLTLYAKKDATEQLRKLNGISIEKLETKLVDDLYIVTATAKTKDGRMDSATGAVTIGHLKGDAKANALMKAETKAKRRVTLSISGMGWCDETEIETIPSAKHVNIDVSTGEFKNESIQEIEMNVNPFYIEKISNQHAGELAQILIECSEESQKGFLEYIRKSYETNSIEGLPEKDFEKLKKILSKKRDDHQKMLAEKEMTINVKPEE
jgi:hypothetical protein